MGENVWRRVTLALGDDVMWKAVSASRKVVGIPKGLHYSLLSPVYLQPVNLLENKYPKYV